VGGVGHIPDPNDGSVKLALLEEPVEPRNTIRPAVSITVEDNEIGLGKINSRTQAIWPLFEPSGELIRIGR
jgi:hypothetical protein